jgi:threonine synthase
MASVNVRCTNCGREYPSTGSPYRCVKCGGIFDFVDSLNFDPKKIEYDQPGIWKYRHTFFSDPELKAFFLGEGDTPLLWSEAFGHPVAFKCEYLNPTGSFKDRGSSLITSFLHSRNINECIEDSSGNAGASMAAYSAAAGIKINIYAPEGSSKIKQKQIEAYGAEVFNIKGSRSTVEDITKQMAEEGSTYASHTYLPFNLPGYATVAYEVYEQLGDRSPGTVMVPVGQGGLLLGLYRGFEALLKAGLIKKIPELVGVQARKCAPLWSIFNGGLDGFHLATDGPTQAEGIRVWHPIRGDSVLSAVGSSKGKFIAVDEEDITIGVNEFAQRGFHIEPTSAVLWSALGQCIDDCTDPVVLILTGSGLKFH